MTVPTNPHLLVVGAGSVGRRHARNFAELSCTISAVDPRADRRDEIASEVDVVSAFESLEAALERGPFDAAIITSPTSFHVDQAVTALGAGLPVYLEKPPAADLGGARQISDAAARADLPVLLGYTWRWWPALIHLRELLESGEIGRVRHVRCSLSAHLADWHPYERYQDFFMSSEALGGGALLDESHWIDLTIWLLGMPNDVFASIATISDLEIDSDDNVDMILRYTDGAHVVLHLDIHGRPHERSLTVSGESGTLAWTDSPNAVRIGRNADDWTSTEFPNQRNDMFVAAAEEFLAVLAGRATPTCGPNDGLRVMRVIDAARQSNATGQVITLDDDVDR